MNTYQFKTNINCSGCVAKVTPIMNQLEGLVSWKVDTDNPSKVLSVELESGTEPAEVVKAVQSAGFSAEQQ